jgi:hypothetical protein
MKHAATALETWTGVMRKDPNRTILENESIWPGSSGMREGAEETKKVQAVTPGFVLLSRCDFT